MRILLNLLHLKFKTAGANQLSWCELNNYAYYVGESISAVVVVVSLPPINVIISFISKLNFHSTQKQRRIHTTCVYTVNTSGIRCTENGLTRSLGAPDGLAFTLKHLHTIIVYTFCNASPLYVPMYTLQDEQNCTLHLYVCVCILY